MTRYADQSEMMFSDSGPNSMYDVEMGSGHTMSLSSSYQDTFDDEDLGDQGSGSGGDGYVIEGSGGTDTSKQTPPVIYRKYILDHHFNKIFHPSAYDNISMCLQCDNSVGEQYKLKVVILFTATSSHLLDMT